jgi:hypothetical protein
MGFDWDPEEIYETCFEGGSSNTSPTSREPMPK